jgi:hypothetical protein
MPIGDNRQFDTPLGGLAEFRGNMQGGDVFSVGEVPVWDGAKFAPGVNAAIVLAFGGLVSTASAGHVADGSVINDWDAITPIGGSPLGVTPVAATGLITADVTGIYEISFDTNVGNLSNAVEYTFVYEIDGSPGPYGTIIKGSNNVEYQSAGFSLSIAVTAGQVVGVRATAPASETFDVISSTLSVSRIG